MRLPEFFRKFLRFRPWATQHGPEPKRRGPVTHVVILDGTMSSLREGEESNAGLTYRLLAERGRVAELSLYYEAGIQWDTWRHVRDVITGYGINMQIRRAYGFLASRYRPGDRIFFFGFSRGAYAVRSLAGVIDEVGLLRAEEATQRAVRAAYRHYERGADSQAAKDFARLFCHETAPIEMVGVWDTVKALGLRLPFLRRYSQRHHAFHNHHLGPSIRHGFHALALDETRNAFTPVLWESDHIEDGQHIEQVWFKGTHSDIGGRLGDFTQARPLANIPLIWMLEKAEACGLVLPNEWQARFPTDPDAPSVGNWRGWGKTFLIRRRRKVGRDATEAIHPTAAASHSSLGVASSRKQTPSSS